MERLSNTNFLSESKTKAALMAQALTQSTNILPITNSSAPQTPLTENKTLVTRGWPSSSDNLIRRRHMSNTQGIKRKSLGLFLETKDKTTDLKEKTNTKSVSREVLAELQKSKVLLEESTEKSKFFKFMKFFSLFY